MAGKSQLNFWSFQLDYIGFINGAFSKVFQHAMFDYQRVSIINGWPVECLAGFDEASQQVRPRKHMGGITNLFPPYVRCQGNMLEECWIMLNHVESIILVICDHCRSLLNTLGPSWSCSTRCLHRSSMAFCQGLTKPAFGYWLRCKTSCCGCGGRDVFVRSCKRRWNGRHPAELLWRPCSVSFVLCRTVWDSGFVWFARSYMSYCADLCCIF